MLVKCGEAQMSLMEIYILMCDFNVCNFAHISRLVNNEITW